jgi:hypothetical protein
VLAVATDGICATEKMKLKAPRDTGTFDCGDRKGDVFTAKPLGGWEHKDIPEGMFLAKPGLYFRLKAELADVRARGVGRREVFQQRDKLMQAFADWDRVDPQHHITMTSRRFYGAKHSVHAQSGCQACDRRWPNAPEMGCPECGECGDFFRVTEMVNDGKPLYGTWDLRNVDVRFDPHPKRERTGLLPGGSSVRLRVRDLGGKTSAEYKTGKTTPEGERAREATEFALEQPDWEERQVDDDF